jgi:urea transport system substrate-binding protein
MSSPHTMLTRRRLGGLGVAAATLAAMGGVKAAFSPAAAQTGPIKVGILHSLSGTMAISETTLKDVMLMLI